MLQQPGKSNKFSPFFSKLTSHNIYSGSSNVCSSDQIVKKISIIRPHQWQLGIASIKSNQINLFVTKNRMKHRQNKANVSTGHKGSKTMHKQVP